MAAPWDWPKMEILIRSPYSEDTDLPPQPLIILPKLRVGLPDALRPQHRHRAVAGQGGHRGTDICAPAGTPIYACDSGTVIEAGWHSSWGNYVLIDHGNGMTTRYAHCTSLLVGAGTNVARGQLIATVGSTGYSSGNHCHLEVTVNGSLTNPMNYF